MKMNDKYRMPVSEYSKCNLLHCVRSSRHYACDLQCNRKSNAITSVAYRKNLLLLIDCYSRPTDERKKCKVRLPITANVLECTTDQAWPTAEPFENARSAVAKGAQRVKRAIKSPAPSSKEEHRERARERKSGIMR